MGPADLIQYVSAAHTRICYSSVSPLQEACAVGKRAPLHIVSFLPSQQSR